LPTKFNGFKFDIFFAEHPSSISFCEWIKNCALVGKKTKISFVLFSYLAHRKNYVAIITFCDKAIFYQ